MIIHKNNVLSAMLFPGIPYNSRSWCGAIAVQNDLLSPCPRWTTRHSCAVIAMVNPFHPLRRNEILQCYSVTRNPPLQSRYCRISGAATRSTARPNRWPARRVQGHGKICSWKWHRGEIGTLPDHHNAGAPHHNASAMTKKLYLLKPSFIWRSL